MRETNCSTKTLTPMAAMTRLAFINMSSNDLQDGLMLRNMDYKIKFLSGRKKKKGK